MKDITKYQGVIPAFYACYDAEGNISTEGVKALTRHLIAKGVKGVYVGGSSGECIYQHVDERKAVLEAVMSEAKGKLTVIAHVGCNNTADSVELARHAESVGVDAIASIPPIYFHLPEYAIAKYWNDMSAAAPNTEFVIYNIPQLAGTGLTMSLLKEMLKNPNVVAVKNSSMPTQDIQMFKDAGIAARGQLVGIRGQVGRQELDGAAIVRVSGQNVKIQVVVITGAIKNDLHTFPFSALRASSCCGVPESFCFPAHSGSVVNILSYPTVLV